MQVIALLLIYKKSLCTYRSLLLLMDLSKLMCYCTDLTKEQRMLSHALVSMIENHLSWAILWWRAKYPQSVLDGYKINLQNTFNTRLPIPILKFCYKLTAGRKVSAFYQCFNKYVLYNIDTINVYGIDLSMKVNYIHNRM